MRYTTLLMLTALLSMVAAVPSHAKDAKQPKYKIRWLLAHNNFDFFEEASQDFKRAVETGSHGNIRVEFVTAAGDGAENSPQAPAVAKIADTVAAGGAEMGHSFTDVVAGVDPKFMVFEAPYLFRGYRHLEGVFEGPLGAEMLDSLRAKHIVGLSFTYSGGANGVASVSREIRGPADMKGLKVGVFGDSVNEAWLRSLGAEPVAIEHRLKTIVPLAHDGKIDAVAITWRNFLREELGKEFKYVNMMGSTHLVSVTYINEKFYESLPEEYRKLIMKASHDTGRIERAKTIELNELAKREMTAKGVREIPMTKAGLGAFTKALAPAYANSIDATVGKDLLERVRKTPDAPSHPAVDGDFAAR